MDPQWQQGFGGVRTAAPDQNPTRLDEKKLKPEQGVSCPRCSSSNTKFCYYNNYSLSQPRYFCKTCRRYWTAGGTLRNVPVGGGSRRKHPKPSNPKPIPQDHQNPKFPPIFNGVPQLEPPNPNLSFMDLLKTTSNFTSLPTTTLFQDSNFPSPFPMHDMKASSSNFSAEDGIIGYANLQETFQHQPGFAVEESKPVFQLNSNGSYWNGVLPPGGSW